METEAREVEIIVFFLLGEPLGKYHKIETLKRRFTAFSII